MDLVRGAEVYAPEQVATIGGIQSLRINTPCGFSEAARGMIESRLDEGGFWVLYGHPHSVSDPRSSQSLGMLEATLAAVDAWRREGRIECILPRDLHSPVPA